MNFFTPEMFSRAELQRAFGDNADWFYQRLAQIANDERDAEMERLRAELTAMQHAHSGLWDAVKTVQELQAENKTLLDSIKAGMVFQDLARLREALASLLKFTDELCEDIGISKHYPSAEKARALLDGGGK